jgi:hypothetical protein
LLRFPSDTTMAVMGWNWSSKSLSNDTHDVSDTGVVAGW